MKKGFTLAEVLITLAIIGVVAALTIPSVIINAREQGNITAFKKAVSVLNSAISLSIAVDSEGPNASTSAQDLIDILSKKMNVISKNSSTCSPATFPANNAGVDGASACWFTTADGMQFILPNTGDIKGSGTNGGSVITAANTWDTAGCSDTTITDKSACTGDKKWHEKGDPKAKASYFGCTDDAPCYIVVDVNGTATPNKLTANFEEETNIKGKVTDRFVIAIEKENAKAATKFDKAVIAK